MEFFRTNDGRPHSGRIAGAIYIAALIPGCREFPDPLCWMRILFTAGWWIAFCPKRSVGSFAELGYIPRILGTVLLLLGLVGQFYLLARR